MSYITNQMAPTYDGGYDHSEPFEAEYTATSSSNSANNIISSGNASSNANVNHAAAYQYETYAMCSRCYTQQDCPHRHTTTTYPQQQQQQGLHGGYGMMMVMTPAVVAAGYARHDPDPPLSSVGVAFTQGYSSTTNSSSNYSANGSTGQGCSQPQQPGLSSPWYGSNNKFASIPTEIQQQQQQQPQAVPYFTAYTDFPGIPMASSEEEMFPHGVHGLPDLPQRSSGGTVAPSALERYPAEQYTHVQTESLNQNQSGTHTTATTTTSCSPSLVTASSTPPSSSSSICSSSSSSSSGEIIQPRPTTTGTTTTHTPFSSSFSLSSSSSSIESRLSKDQTYHLALYGHNPATKDPCSPRAVANRQIVPILAAQHGHPVWPLNTKAKKNTYLLEAKKRGVSYREIKEYGEISDAESTLRGRYRMLTKSAEERVRRPVWEERDLQLLHCAVQLYTDGRQRKRARRQSTASAVSGGYSSEDATALTTATEPRISWKGVAEYIARNGGSYKFGYATCKKKWEEFNFGV